ncbi:hypothetical protein LCGC14_1342480 [marine sediment metagenome]|uniref:Uncharacterized protein n=1 Tax=marine sediment metagenome TaxID=412755 RepID=A0A0F9KZL9_9ZZZZ
MSRGKVNVGHLVVPEPAEPTPVEKLLAILVEIDAELRKETKRGAGCLARYWQGKKDGIRIAMIVQADDSDGDIRDIKSLQRSTRESRYTSGEEAELFNYDEDTYGPRN